MINTQNAIFHSLNICPEVVYEFLEHGIEAERCKFLAERVLNSTEAYYTYDKILQAERLLCFMRRAIRSQEANHLP